MNNKKCIFLYSKSMNISMLARSNNNDHAWKNYSERNNHYCFVVKTENTKLRDHVHGNVFYADPSFFDVAER